jgi:hypothetical protein
MTTNETEQNTPDFIKPSPIEYELKKSNRFHVELPASWGIESWVVQSIDSPTMSFKLNSDSTASSYDWNPLRITFIDPIGPSASVKLFDLALSSGFNGHSLIINALDPDYNVISQWRVTIKEILSINFGEFNYNMNEALEPYILIKPEDCTLLY